MSLPRFSVHQVVFVNLLFAIVMVAGLLFAGRIPIDVFPDISFNQAIVTTLWQGASADEVERLVTTKLEDEIRDVDGIKNLTSYSQAGLSEISVEWQETLSEIEYEAAVNELRAAVDRVGDLPEDAEEPVIRELSVSETFNVCMVAVTDVGDVGEYTLREVARDVERGIERLDGVRKATLRGERDRELRVYVDRDRALQYDLTLPEIAQTIRANNQNVPAGTLSTGSSEITVRGLGNFTTPAELGATVILKDPNGDHVRLRDVARVEEGFAKRRILGRYNGRPTIVVGISKTGDADIIDLVDRVRAYMADYATRLPPGVEAPVTWDSSRFVRVRMGVMVSNVVLGVVFVVFVLWLSVGFRNAMIVTVGIPFSFLCAFLLFPLFGVTINLISLVGFVLVSGMLVDHAIVMVENIYRHVERGVEIREAVIRGSEEVMWPVIATVATTLAAFIPALMIRGTSGEFGSIMPKTVIIVLTGSLLEALVVLPAHYVDWGSRRGEAGAAGARDGRLARITRASAAARAAVDRVMVAARERYVGAQGAVLPHRGLFLLACVAALYASCGLQKHVGVDLFPSDFNQLYVTLKTPNDFGIEQSDEVVRGIEAQLDGLGDEISEYTSYVGFGLNADMEPVNGVNYGVVFVTFPDSQRNQDDPFRVLHLVRETLEPWARANPALVEHLSVLPPRNGPPIGKPVAIRVQADDYAVAKRVAAEMKAELATLPGVYNIEDNVPDGPLELRVALDEQRASVYGLTFDPVAASLRAANDGLVPSTFKDPASDEDVDIRVLPEPGQRDSMKDLLEVEVRTADGGVVPLGDVARIEVARGYQRLYHYDARRAVVVYADVDDDTTSSTFVNALMQSRFADVPERYPGVDLVFGGEFEATRETMEDMMRALWIAILAIYAILATLFRSYLQPLVVMSVVFFSFMGVTVGLFLTGNPLSMWVMYAGVGLAGIVVNDSLVLVDFINRLRAEGASPAEAVSEASRQRFRPIFLTTVTTIAGLAPMALGLTGKSTVFGPFASAIVFGLGAASLLTLFVVPALYLMLEDARVWLARRRERGALPAPGAVAGGSR